MDLAEFRQLEHRAEAGEVQAMHILGKLYRTGFDYISPYEYVSLHVPKDTERAKELLNEAAAKGHNPSLLLLDQFDKMGPVPLDKLDEKYLRRINVAKERAFSMENAFSQLVEIFILGFQRLFGAIKWLTFISLMAVFVALAIKGIAALPVSLAVIIGAVIIAGAVKK
jgi:TPR repeat protein